ncbi:MAG: endonuclease/exonuclease/phosphatase family protein [Verrucomicrobia bacterium]|nr:endonuclease/exonuclease/phosphatase family protein [Verrucomicrobiota bacterium]
MKRRITLRIGAPRRMFLAGVFGLLGLLLGGCAAPSSPPAPPPRLRVATFNIHHGEGLDGKVDLERIARLIRRFEPDLVALEEVDRGVARTARRDMPAELARLTGMRCLFANNFSYQGGEYGNAILVRLPVVSWTNHLYRMLRKGEQRGLLQAAVRFRGRTAVFMATHLDYRRDEMERLMQAAEIREIADGVRADCVIVAGDFNALPGSGAWRAMAERFRDAWLEAGPDEGFTFPAAAPKRRIDYIWIRRGSACRPIRAWVPQTDVSDHRPVFADILFGP